MVFEVEHSLDKHLKNRSELKRIIDEKLKGRIDWKTKHIRIIANLYKRFLKTKVDELLESDAAFYKLICPYYTYGYYTNLVSSICISRIECKLGMITTDEFIDALNVPDRDGDSYQRHERVGYNKEFTEWAVKNSELI